MYVPGDSYGSVSPEKRAANWFRTYFTSVAVKIVIAQLSGSGSRPELGSYNQVAYDALTLCLKEVPLQDGDEWLAQLMRRNSVLALRILEVREAYCREDFEWDQLQRLALKGVQEGNLAVMRRYATASLQQPSAMESDDLAATNNVPPVEPPSIASQDS